MYYLLGVQTFHVLITMQKCKKIPKSSKILKNDCHIRIPHPQMSLKQFSNICEKGVCFFYYKEGWKND